MNSSNHILAKIVGILKSHESVVTKEKNVVSSIGSLALLSKGKNVDEEEEVLDLSGCDLTNDEYALMVSNPKKFARKKFPITKNRNWQGSYSSEKAKEEPKITPQHEEAEKENKLVGDSGYDCNFCHGKNHFAKDCMLRKLTEKKDGEDDEAYRSCKLEEIKKKKTSKHTINALIMKGNIADDEFGGVEVWSTDSEDEKVRKPTHGRAFVAKEGNYESSGRCMMVTARVSQMRGYITECKGEEAMDREECFAAKPMGEQIKKCDKLIKKVQSILEYLKLPVNNYEKELNDLKFKFSSLSGSLK